MPFRLTETAYIYSIRVDGKEKTEFQEFLINYKDTENTYLKDDFNRIMATLNTMINNGIKEIHLTYEDALVLSDKIQTLQSIDKALRELEDKDIDTLQSINNLIIIYLT